MFIASLTHDIICGKIQITGLIPLFEFTVNDISSKSTTLDKKIWVYMFITAACRSWIIHSPINSGSVKTSITKEALGFWTVKLFRKMGCGCYCFPISEMGDACYAATCIFQVKSTMDTPLAMGAFVSARFLKFLLSTTVHNSLRVIFTVCTYAGKALWFKVRDWSLRVRDVQCMDELIFLVLEVDCRTVSPRLLTDFGFPCSKGGPQTIQNLTKQFHPSLTEELRNLWRWLRRAEPESVFSEFISWVWLEEHTVPGIKAVLRVGGDVVNGRRSAMVILAATLFSSTYGSASANAGVIDDFYERSKPTKELNDKKTLATSGANFVRESTLIICLF
ncbi:hypothetical protein IGI04_014719 [Brassica rapa subsp. trilocularis]|uniref:Uncharacterized protein n=1 Tax=Brassica rapa subsp. trilocularis TaxID=1813537 RepID=A0ABQ7MMZ3_BRACM|nr:hypothetical protein IGI04_014719 [Brassica rapa subsp. trilocularis]